MRKKIFYGRWIVTACFFLGLYKSSVVFYGFTAFMEPLVRDFGWTYTQVFFAVWMALKITPGKFRPPTLPG